VGLPLPNSACGVGRVPPAVPGCGNRAEPGGMRGYQAEPSYPIKEPPKTDFSAFSVISAVED
jgi:hypothetical protein